MLLKTKVTFIDAIYQKYLQIIIGFGKNYNINMTNRLFAGEVLYSEGLYKPYFRGKIHAFGLLLMPVYVFFLTIIICYTYLRLETQFVLEYLLHIIFCHVIYNMKLLCKN